MSSSPALLTDLYQLTMAAGYFHRGMHEARAACSMFVRRLPPTRRYLVAMGLDAFLDYLEDLRFGSEQIEYLREVPALREAMTPAFEAYLRDFRFTGNVDAVPEGTLVFANEPLLRVEAPIVEAQVVETFLLSKVNHATMIASKAARVLSAAGDAGVMEFGTRRTHPEAAVDAARAACAVGFVGTSNLEAGKRFGLPVLGTAAHMWTMAHESEEAAFESYVSVFPSAATLLIDTYDTARGAERAARIAKEKLRGVRLDSGDLRALSFEVRKVLDAEGCEKAKIVASGDLNEHKIAALRAAKAPIDLYGVGTELVASVDAPALSGVYKLTAISRGGETRPIAKFSESKATYPGLHQVHRHFEDGALAFDTLALASEPAPPGTEPLLVPAMRGGFRVLPREPLASVRARFSAGRASLPARFLSLEEESPEERRVSAGLVRPTRALLSLVDEVRVRVGSAS